MDMTHWKAWREGRISLKTARRLSALKNFGHKKQYRKEEKKHGV